MGELHSFACDKNESLNYLNDIRKKTITFIYNIPGPFLQTKNEK